MADQADIVPRGVDGRRIEAEVARISAATDFARAPVMRRLLDFLVAETLAGRGDSLKAYAVAVDGLGRPDDFDAQADSYPRVQVGRLRRMLEAFYAREGVADGIRLHIPPGQYRVFFESDVPSPAAAPDSSTAIGEPATGTATPPMAGEGGAPATSPPWIAIVGTLLAIVVAALVGAAIYLTHPADTDMTGDPNRLTLPPELSFAPITGPADRTAIERSIDTFLVDGLRRSWLIRLHEEEKGVTQAEASEAVRRELAQEPPNRRPYFRLTGTLTSGAEPELQLQLTNIRSGELVWTGQAAIGDGPDAIRTALSPIVTELIQPYGVIATATRAVEGDRFAPGHRCLLEFDRYRRDRNAALNLRLRECVDHTLALEPGHAMALAAKSFLELDRKVYRLDPSAPDDIAVTSLAYARRAAMADPYNAFIQLTLARASQFAGTCALTVRSSRRALELNPYDPDLMGIAGLLLLNCGQPDAEDLIRRAVKLDPEAPLGTRNMLIYLALDRNDIATAQRMVDALPPPTATIQASNELVRAVVAASAGDMAKAKAAWARLEAVDPQTAQDPDSMYRRWMMPQRLRDHSLAVLARAGLIPPRAPSAAAP
ncbi:hypothetical protein [Edaphosphingomonas haloaromaticamans]|uniref:hypothetical protein n=1 Tax=Edaphosphingomonas haloaromaticamans TaxID=653954 RepID=UPI0020C7A432|nr:hypothetical protein [Sphingomonas haloaromaticamans]